MDNKITFLLKVLLLSLGLSVLIKFLGPLLAIPTSSTIALVAVCLPSVILALLFSWRARATFSTTGIVEQKRPGRVQKQAIDENHY